MECSYPSSASPASKPLLEIPGSPYECKPSDESQVNHFQYIMLMLIIRTRQIIDISGQKLKRTFCFLIILAQTEYVFVALAETNERKTKKLQIQIDFLGYCKKSKRNDGFDSQSGQRRKYFLLPLIEFLNG